MDVRTLTDGGQTAEDVAGTLGGFLDAARTSLDLAVRDAASVWTGSTNWTQDSWTREENVIVMVDAPGVAAAFTRDFGDLWDRGRVVGSGEFDPDPVMVDGARVRVWFSPGRGRKLAHRIATAIGRSERRI